MSRKKRSYKKNEPFRDARYVLIVGEGKAEKKYFEGVQEQVLNEIDRKRIKLRISPFRDGGKSPNQIVGDAFEFKDQFKDFVIGFDVLWVLFDLDSNTDDQIHQAVKDCNSHSLNLAISSPCFELWLFLHISDLKEKTFNIEPIVGGKRNIRASTNCKKEIRKILGSYNESNIPFDKFVNEIKTAYDRASFLDQGDSPNWPRDLGTEVYKIFDLFSFISE